MKISVKNILWAYAFLVLILAYIFGLFVDLTGDSGLYATIARQMVESGDWLTLKINGELYDQKPHLIFWLAGIGIKIFGNTNFAFKIFPTLWALAGVYFTYRLGKLLYSEAAGKLAALIAGTSQIFILYLFDVHTDTILQTSVVLAVWQLVAYLKTNKNLHFFLAFSGVGLAMFSKGPVGAVVPFFVVLFYLIFNKEYNRIFQLKWILGIVIVLVIISPTLVHLYKSFGAEGIRFYFITNNFGRISGEYAGSSNDPFYYIYNSLWSFLPWTVFVVFALYSEIKSWFSGLKKETWGVSLLGSILVFMLILSVAKGKAPNYFLLAVPIISVITGKRMNFAFGSKKNRNLVSTQWILLIFLLAFYGFIITIYNENKILISLVLLVIVFVMTFISKRIETGSYERILLITLLITGSINLNFVAVILPHLFSYQGARKAIEIFEQNHNPGDKLYNFELEEYELFFYSESPVIQLKDWNYLYEAMEKSGSWVYTNSIKQNDIIKMNYKIDTIYQINHKGMNRVSLEFLNPKTRENSLESNYLIKTK